MTITYSHKVSKVRLCGFARLLCYWKGSIYKLLYKEMAFYVVFYTILTCVYRFALKEPQKRQFEKMVIHFDRFTNLIPMSFIVGFYVSIVITRWWQQFTSIPWPDRVAIYAATMIRGADESSRILRRSMIRYLNLASVLVFQSISTPVKKRFPTMDHLILAGLMTDKERLCFESVETPHPKFWIPCMWSSTLASRAREEGKIADDVNLKAIIDEITAYRSNLGMLFSYDWISIPLVYTQVTTLAVYMYFFACLMGRQFLDPAMNYSGHDVDLYVPVFTMLQFFFYVGWIKVAEQLINPFGEDDDDFEVNWIIDRNVQVGLLIVDQMYMSTPVLEKDPFWGTVDPQLPYTKSSLSTKVDTPFMGSTADLSLTTNDMRVVMNSAPTLEPIIEGKRLRHHDDVPSSSPVKRKMYLDLNCPSPLIRSSEVLCERNSHIDLKSGTPRTPNGGLNVADVNKPLMSFTESARPTSPLVGRDWMTHQQDQYLKSLQNDASVSPHVSGDGVETTDNVQLTTGERFLQNWLRGRPSVSDELGVGGIAKEEEGSNHGAEIGVDLLKQSNQKPASAPQAESQLDGSHVINICDDTNAVFNLQGQPSEKNLSSGDVPQSCGAENVPAEECSGKAYVESWLQVNQDKMQNPCTEEEPGPATGHKFEVVNVAGPFSASPSTTKLRNPQVSFSDICAQIPNVDVLPDSVGIEMPGECDEEETGRISGNSSYCTQSTVNSMKALLSSTE